MIKDDFFVFSRMVDKFDSYSEIQNIINSLNYVKNEKINSKEDRSDYGYLSRRLNSQFLGYLLVDQQRDQLQAAHSQIFKYGLEDKEKRLVEKYHIITVELDKRVLHPLLEKFEGIFRILDPYNKFRYIPTEDSLLTDKDKEMIEHYSCGFNTHPAMSFLLSMSRDIYDDETKILQLLLSFENEITRSGIESTPTKIIDMRERIGDINQYLVLLALLSLRGTLEIFNQLFFQSILLNKFIYLDDDSIINYTGPIYNVIGKGYKISFQKIMGLEPGDIFLFNEVLSKKDKQLCRVEFEEFRMSDDIGYLSSIDARYIDDNLDPYSELSKAIIQ